MSGTTVVDARRDKYDVLIARPSKWGNPFIIGRDGTRDQVIERFRHYIKTKPELLAALHHLRGKRLGCFCGEQRCHGDVLIELLEAQQARPVETPKTAYDPKAHGANCAACPLNKCKPVPPVPVPDAQFVIVGEAPGRTEVQKGAPFIGPSGRLLDKLLSSNGLNRSHAHVTNAILCRPETEAQAAEAEVCCAPRFFAELGALNPKVPIVALGAHALRMTVGVNGILKARGFVWEVPTLSAKELRKAEKAAVDSFSATTKLKTLRQAIAGRTVLPTLHPEFILRTEIWGAVVKIDMARIARWVKRGKLPLEDHAKYHVVSTAAELRRLGSRIGPHVTVDIETDGPDPLHARMVCVGLGDERVTIVAHPWKPSMARALTEICAKRFVVGHNIIGFDALVLRRHGVALDPSKIEDTMIAHHAFASHLPKSLLHVASVFCDTSPWKHTAKGGKQGEKGLPHHLSAADLTKYNAADVRLTALAWARMQPDIEKEVEIYAVGKRMAELCSRMRERGFAFDTDRARDLAKTLQGRKNALLGEMRKLTHMSSFSPTRPTDIRKALFGRFHSTLIRPTATGLPSTARAVLEILRGSDTKAGQLSDLVLRWRSADKTKGTYLTVDLGEDGRVHGDWRLGPQTGRLACRIMTLPRYAKDKTTGLVDPTARVRECYVAKPGYTLVYFDLSQAEMRFAANLSGDERFIEACGGDVHAGNARVLFPWAVEDGSLATDEAAKGPGKKYRDIAKNAGFAVTYLAEWETVYAFLTSHGFKVSIKDVRAMMARLHVAYAGYFEYVRRNVEFVQKHGYFRTAVMGRIRWFGRYPKPTEVANYPVQGGIADLMNERLLKVDSMLTEAQIDMFAYIIAQIHDAAILEVRDDLVKQVKGIIKSVYDPPVVLPGREPFLVPIDLKTGKRWSELG